MIQPKCQHCRKTRHVHAFTTGRCPRGRKHNGFFIKFGPTKWTPRTPKPRTGLSFKTISGPGAKGSDPIGQPYRLGMKRTPLAPMSKKRIDAAPGRRACIAAVRKRCGGKCEATAVLPWICTGRMKDTHEILARSQGGDPNDPANCLGVCRPCHDWITGNMNKARQLGLAK